MRSLIVGGLGQVGTALRLALGEDAYRVTSSARPHVDENVIPFDLLEACARPTLSDQLLTEDDFDTIYCSGAMTNVELCETDSLRAHRINCEGPANLAMAASRHNVKFVFFSTDYVFDGLRGPYAEEDKTNPLSVYGKSKLEGERAVLKAHPNALIVRTTVVYGPDPGRRNFVYSLMTSISEGRIVKTAADQFSTPTYSRDLASAAVKLATRNAVGVINVSGPQLMSRTEFSHRVARCLKLDRSKIDSVNTFDLRQVAKRPLVAGLKIDKLSCLLPESHMHSVEDAMMDWQSKMPNFA